MGGQVSHSKGALELHLSHQGQSCLGSFLGKSQKLYLFRACFNVHVYHGYRIVFDGVTTRGYVRLSSLDLALDLHSATIPIVRI